MALGEGMMTILNDIENRRRFDWRPLLVTVLADLLRDEIECSGISHIDAIFLDSCPTIRALEDWLPEQEYERLCQDITNEVNDGL